MLKRRAEGQDPVAIASYALQLLRDNKTNVPNIDILELTSEERDVVVSMALPGCIHYDNTLNMDYIERLGLTDAEKTKLEETAKQRKVEAKAREEAEAIHKQKMLEHKIENEVGLFDVFAKA